MRDVYMDVEKDDDNNSDDFSEKDGLVVGLCWQRRGPAIGGWDLNGVMTRK